MNPLAVAAQRALKVSSDRPSLLRNFEQFLSEVEFAPDAQSAVLGVPRAAALAWARGDFHDLDLVLSIKDAPEAIWWSTLPRWSEYQAGLEAARGYYERGASMILCHTANPVVRKHCERFGCVVTHTDGNGVRLLGGREVVDRWLGRVARNGVTAPRSPSATPELAWID